MVLLVPVSVIVMLVSFFCIALTPILPEILTLPEVVISPEVLISPVAASIVKGPTVSPLWTTKFELAIVPYLPNSFNKVIYARDEKDLKGKKIAPEGAIFRQLTG